MILVSLMRNSGKALQDNFLGATEVKIKVKVDQVRDKWHWLVGKESHLQKSFSWYQPLHLQLGKVSQLLDKSIFLLPQPWK